MNFTDNSKRFLEKLCSSLNLSNEQGQKLLQETVHGDRISQIINGEIISLNIRGLAHAKSSILKQEGIRERVQLLDATQIDLSDLLYLNSLNFVASPRNEISVPNQNFKFYPDLESLTLKFHKTNAINISSCRNLTDLDCSSNLLETLDLTQNLSLQKLNCQLNPIKTLNLSENNKLTYVLANSTELTEDSLTFPKENHISEIHLRGSKIRNFDPVKFSDLAICRLSGLEQDVFNTSSNNHLLRLELSNSKIKEVSIKKSSILSEFVVTNSNFDQIICNEFQASVIPFLSKQFNLSKSPEQTKLIESISLHKKASKLNWDGGLDKLKKILKSPNCDVATATMIYWLGNPNYFLKYKKINDANDSERKLFRFLTKLEKRILANEFKTNIIDFNPSIFMGVNWLENSYCLETSIREIPDSLKDEIKGKEIETFDLNKEYKGKL